MAMQFSVKGKQMDVGDALRRHIEESVTALVGKYFGSGIEAHAVLGREAHLYCCDLSVHVGRGILMQASEKDTDPYLASDKAAGRIAKRLRRHKRRLRDHHVNGADRKIIQAEQAQYAILSAGDHEDEHAGRADGADADDGLDHAVDPTDGQPAIVAEMTTDLSTLTVGEAVMRLDLADQPALMFRNSAHGGLNVVYRRKDGNIGWIDPGHSGREGTRN